MSILLTIIVSTAGIFLGRYLFKYWINHLTLYCSIWVVLITLYELKLIPYYDLIPTTWFFIVSAFLSFLFGILTVFSLKRSQSIFEPKIINTTDIRILRDGGTALRIMIIFCSMISILAAIQHWAVLLKTFGSIPMAILNANLMYKLNVSGNVKGIIPYISNFGPVAIFFGGIYAAYKGKFSFLSFLPFLGIILEGLATVGRTTLLFAIMEFVFTFLLFRNLLNIDEQKKFMFSKLNAVITVTIMLSIFIAIMSLVRLSRVTQEDFAGASSELRGLKNNIILSPSVYLYLSCDIGVLNQYLKSNGERTKFGENSFMLIHYILADLKIVKRPNDLQKGYKIPQWANTGTYIRELHADFGILGIYLGPFIIGFLTTWLWFKFYKEFNVFFLAILVYLYIVVGFTFLMMITRLAIWSISIVFLLVLIPIAERLAMILSYKNDLQKEIN